jgi:hypothetical protein
MRKALTPAQQATEHDMKTSTKVIGAISRTPTRFAKPRAPVYFVDPATGDVLELCFNTATFTK